MKANPDSLMGDLETIRELLEEEDWPADQADTCSLDSVSNTEPDVAAATSDSELAARAELPMADAEPLLPRTDLGATPDLTPDATIEVSAEVEPTSRPAAAQDLFDRAFTSETDVVMSRARALIQEHPNAWSPQQTDELCDALKVRIDDTVHRWIDETLARHRRVLEDRLVKTIQNELAEHLQMLEVDSGAPLMGSDSTNDG